jgi:hypothetical protein
MEANNEVDLFEHYNSLPTEVHHIIEKYADMETTYGDCEQLVAELNSIGYTCDYGLDGTPFGLRKL